MTASENTELHRVLGMGLLVFYGVGIIIGAGVYVVVGDVMAISGQWALWAFIVAGFLAALTALCYAEMGVRYPEAAGAAAYAREAFNSAFLSRVTGFGVAATILISAAAIASGTAAYAGKFIDLPDKAIAGLVVVIFTAIACMGVRDSVRLASVMTLIEIGGLVLVVSVGAWSISSGSFPDEGNNLALSFPAEMTAWQKIFAGAFLAFFAFTGFENLANMAEEAQQESRTVPMAILISLGISTVLYLVVVMVVGAMTPVGQPASATPLLAVFRDENGAFSLAFSGLALVAVSNGVLIQILTLARLFYGMARRRLLPAVLMRVSKNRIPLQATLVAGGMVLVCTLALPFESLLRLSTSITLAVFAVVCLSLCRIKLMNSLDKPSFRIPAVIPWIAAAGNVGLIVIGFMH